MPRKFIPSNDGAILNRKAWGDRYRDLKSVSNFVKSENKNATKKLLKESLAKEAGKKVATSRLLNSASGVILVGSEALRGGKKILDAKKELDKEFNELEKKKSSQENSMAKVNKKAVKGILRAGVTRPGK